MSDKPLTASFKRNTERNHCFILDGWQGITGNLYIPKGDDIPKRITIEFNKIDKAKMKNKQAKEKPSKITLEEFNRFCALYGE
jgi:hypothetical protein